MRLLRSLIVTSAAFGAMACRGEPARVDDALRQDLSLASQAQPYMAQPYVSPMELSYDAYGRPVYQPAPYRAPAYPAPVPVATRQAPRIYRAPSSGSVGTSAGTAEQRNTQRDAILGAAAGAAIGMATSRDRLKGAVIGAAAGGVLGAIYGQKVDVNKIPR
ncbi:MAG: glycine zipper domain-containing protein [Gemmatimonadaceae bacterium]